MLGGLGRVRGFRRLLRNTAKALAKRERASKSVYRRAYTQQAAKQPQAQQAKNAQVLFTSGLPSVVLPLPNKQNCRFPLYPARTVNEFTVDIRSEDRLNSDIYVTDANGVRVSLATPMMELTRSPFVVNIDGAAFIINASESEKPVVENVLGTPELSDLAIKAYYQEIRGKLAHQSQSYMPYNKYLEWCDDIGLTEAQARELSRALHLTGEILHFHQSPDLRDFIFLRTAPVTNTITQSLGISFATRRLPQLLEELNGLLPEYLPLHEKKLALDERAIRSSQLWMKGGLVYLVVQFGILARMVWWDFNWDIMEPISYFVSLSTLMLGFFFFVLYRQEYTYQALENRQRLKALRKLYINEQFNWKRWNELNQQVESIKAALGPNNIPLALKNVQSSTAK